MEENYINSIINKEEVDEFLLYLWNVVIRTLKSRHIVTSSHYGLDLSDEHMDENERVFYGLSRENYGIEEYGILSLSPMENENTFGIYIRQVLHSPYKKGISDSQALISLIDNLTTLVQRSKTEV